MDKYDNTTLKFICGIVDGDVKDKYGNLFT